MLTEKGVCVTFELIEELISGTNDIAFVFDKDYKLIAASPGLTRLLQLEETLLIGRRLSDVFTHLPPGHEGAYFDRVWDGQAVYCEAECFVLPPDASLSGRYLPVMESEGKVESVIGIIRCQPVSAIPEVQHDNEGFYRTVIDNTFEGISILDKTGQILYESPRIEKMIGYMPEQLVGRNLIELVAGPDKEKARQLLKLVLARPGESTHCHLRFLHRDQSVHILEISLINMLDNEHIRGIISNFRDATEYQETRKALLRQKDMYRTLMETANEGIWMIDESSNNVFINQKMADMLGYSIEEMMSKPLFAFMEETEHSQASAIVKKRRNGIEEQHEFRFRHKDDSVVWALLSINPIFEEGVYKGSLAMVTDITRMKNAEEELKDQQHSFRLLFSHNPLPMWLFDVDTLKFIEVNRAMEVHYGWTRDELLDMKVTAIRPDSAIPAFMENINRIRRSHDDRYEGEWKHLRRNGELIDMEVIGYRIVFAGRDAFIVVGKDVTQRKRAEAALKASEECIRFALNSSQITLLNQDLALRYTWIHSPQFGSGAGSIIGKTDAAIYEADEAERITTIKRRVLATGVGTREEVYLRYGDSMACYVLIIEPLRNADRQIIGLTCAMYDDTQRRHNEEYIHYQANLLESVSDTIIATDVDYRITSWNKAAENTYGWKAEEVIGARVGELLKIKYTEVSREQVMEYFNSVGAWQGEIITSNRTGKHLYILASVSHIKDSTGKTIGLVSIHRDITDRKRWEESLRIKDKAMASSINGIVMASLDNRINYANPALLNMWGYESANALMGKPLCELVQDCEEQLRVFEALWQSGSWIGETLARRKDGSSFDVQVSATMVNSKADRPLCMMFSFIDITERKQNEEERRMVTEELMRSNTELKQFAYITSHNLRAPIVNISSLLSLYDRHNPGNDFNPVVIDKLEESVNRLSVTLEDLVQVVAIKEKQQVKREILCFENVLDEVVRSIEGQINEARAEIRADFSAARELCYPHSYLQSILLNLLTNAIKYKAYSRTPVVELYTEHCGDFICLSVRDNGIGIDLQKHGSKLFGLYQRFHDSADGKGLGLYIVKSQVEALGGRITVESQPGQGTIFKIFFKTW